MTRPCHELEEVVGRRDQLEEASHRYLVARVAALAQARQQVMVVQVTGGTHRKQDEACTARRGERPGARTTCRV